MENSALISVLLVQKIMKDNYVGKLAGFVLVLTGALNIPV